MISYRQYEARAKERNIRWLRLVLLTSVLLAVLAIYLSGRVEQKERVMLPNEHCGEGVLISDFDAETITTPNGYVFKVVYIQRSPQGEVTGSYSYNPNSNQLFCFVDRKPYKDMLGNINTRDMIPSVVFGVEK